MSDNGHLTEQNCSPEAEPALEHLTIPPDPALLAQGWVNRFVTSSERADEMAELYASLGFEVRLEAIRPQSLGAYCQDCQLALCRSYVMIYTRQVEKA